MIRTETSLRPDKSMRTEPSLRADASPRRDHTFDATDPIFASNPVQPRETRVEPEWTAASDREPGVAMETWQTPRFRYAPPASNQTQAGFGPYARSAAAELGASSGAEDKLATPANSNTAPRRRADTSDAAPAARIEPEIISPCRSCRDTRARTDRSRVPDRVDVVLKRETATVSLPLDTANDHGGLIGRLTDALTAIDTFDRKNLAAPAAAIIDISGFGPSEFGTRMPDQELKLLEPVGHDNEAEISNDDAATMAGRLGPAIRNGKDATVTSPPGRGCAKHLLNRFVA